MALVHSVECRTFRTPRMKPTRLGRLSPRERGSARSCCATSLPNGRRTTLLPTLQIRPELGTTPVPLGQVTDSLEPRWEDPVLSRYDRLRQVAVQASPVDHATSPMLHAAVLPEINAIQLPPLVGCCGLPNSRMSDQAGWHRPSQSRGLASWPADATTL
jgi:hypothetical protein